MPIPPMLILLMLESDVDDGVLIPVIVMDAIAIEAMVDEGIDIADEDILIVVVAMEFADVKIKDLEDPNTKQFDQETGYL